MKSWKTTLAGLATLATSIQSIVVAYSDNDISTMPDWNIQITNIIIGIGLLFAKDFNVSGSTIEDNKDISNQDGTSHIIIK